MFIRGGRDEDGARAGNRGKEGEEKMTKGGGSGMTYVESVLHFYTPKPGLIDCIRRLSLFPIHFSTHTHAQ